MSIIKTPIHIGLPTPIRLMHMTDTHLYLADMRDGERKVKLSHRRARHFSNPEKTLAEGDVLKLGDEEIRVLHTPGHTEGSVCFLCGEDILITGDTLFDRGFGRYDLWGGDPLKLRRSLARLASLDHSLTIYAGHGCSTDLGDATDNCAFL